MDSVIIAVLVVLGIIVAGGFLLYFLGDLLMGISGKKKDVDAIREKQLKQQKELEERVNALENAEEARKDPEIATVLYGSGNGQVEAYDPNEEEEEETVEETPVEEEVEEETTEETEEDDDTTEYIRQRRKELLERLAKMQEEREAEEEEEDVDDTVDLTEEEETPVEEPVDVPDEEPVEEETTEEVPVEETPVEEEVAPVEEPATEPTEETTTEETPDEDPQPTVVAPIVTETTVTEEEVAKKVEEEIVEEKMQEAKDAGTNALATNFTLEELEARLAEEQEKLKNNEKELRKCKKEFIPLRRVKNTLESDEKKLRRKEALVAKQKVVLYGVNNYADIDNEKAQKLAEDLDLLDGLKLSVQHCQEVMDKNQERYPLLEQIFTLLSSQNEIIKDDIKKLQDAIAQLKGETTEE